MFLEIINEVLFKEIIQVYILCIQVILHLSLSLSPFAGSKLLDNALFIFHSAKDSENVYQLGP